MPLSDIEIARAATIKPIEEIAAKLHIPDDDLELYGHYKAKISLDFYHSLDNAPTGKLSHSWPKNMGQIPINFDDSDYASDPHAFPIGHGLSW